MRNRPGRLIVSIVLICAIIFDARLLNAQEDEKKKADDARSEIVQLENRWLKAIEAADIPALNSILADDFVRPVPSAGRFITKSQYLNYYKSHLPAPANMPKRIENLQVTIYDNTAIARGSVITSDTQGHRVSRSLFTDVFVDRAGKWQAVSAQENKSGE